MKKAPPVRLSLRKLFIAMLATGPLAILPAPVLAAVPQGSTANPPTTGVPPVAVHPFTVVNGNVTWNGSGTLLSINSSTNNSIISWADDAFRIAAGETFNFTVPNGSAILNKVGYNSAGNAIAPVPDDAIINGNLQSNGRVFILANGNIFVGGGAQISSQGLFLSTVRETDNFNFSALGNLTFTGTTNDGAITIGGTNALGGSTTSQVGIVGPVGAWGGSIALNNVSVSGDMILNSRTPAAALALTGPNGRTNVTGNLTVVTNNANVTQNTFAGTAGSAAVPGNNGPDGIAGTADDVAPIPAVAAVPANSLTVGGSLALTTGTGVATLNNAANNFATVTINGAGATIVDTADLVLGNSTVGASGLTASTTGNISTSGAVAVAVGGNVSLTSTAAGGNITFANGSSVGGSFTGSTVNGNVTIDTVGALTLGRANPTTPVTYTGVTAGGTGNITANTTGALTIAGPLNAVQATLTGTSISSITGGQLSLATTPTATAVFNATSGSVILPSVTAYAVTVNATAGSISQLAGSVITTTNGSTSTFVAAPSGSINLSNANLLGQPVPTTGIAIGSVNLTGGTVTINNGRGLAIGDSQIGGSLTINTQAAPVGTGNVVLGAGFGSAAVGLTIGGSLNVTTASSEVTDNGYAPWEVLGSVTINTTAPAIVGGVAGPATAGANVRLSAAGEGLGNPRTSFGQINITAGTGVANVIETTTLNLGTISAALVQANSTQGSIIQTGAITSAGSGTGNPQNRFAVSNNTTTSIILDNPANVFTTASSGDGVTGNITFVGGNNNVLTSASHVRMDNRTNVSGGNMTINATGNIILEGGNYRNLTLNATDSVHFQMRNEQTLTTNRLQVFAGSSNATAISSAINQDRRFTNNGVVTLSTPGGVMLTNEQLSFNIVSLNNVVGDSYIYGRNSFTVNGTTPGSVTVVAGTNNSFDPVGGQYNAILGDLRVGGNLTVYALNGLTDITGLTATNPGLPAAPLAVAGISGSVMQQNATTSVAVSNVTTFVTAGGNVQVTNNNNSFGRVNASTGGQPALVGATGNISITEYDTLRVGTILTNGTASLTSRFGSIIEDPIGSNITVGRLVLSAPSGSILLGNVSGLTTGNIAAANITAGGAASIASSGNIVLGAIQANSLTVTANNISQSAPLSVFGLASFTAGNNSTPALSTTTGSIVLNDPANNFGPIAITSINGNQAVSITENSTLNLRTVNMPAGGSNGTFTANSINGDIIDSGLGFVRLGGTVLNNVASSGSAIVTLTATNGDIVINDPTSDILSNAGIVFNARNVTLSVLGTPGATLALGANNTTSVATGNLTVSSAQGNIGNMGRFNVGGLASFTTGLGNIQIDQPNVGFGQLAFSGNQVRITEAGNMNILSSSRASGPVQLISGGSIEIVQVGTEIATFGNVVNLQAANDIILRSMQALGTVTLVHGGTANLSALRISDLLGSPQWVSAAPDRVVPPSGQ